MPGLTGRSGFDSRPRGHFLLLSGYFITSIVSLDSLLFFIILHAGSLNNWRMSYSDTWTALEAF